MHHIVIYANNAAQVAHLLRSHGYAGPITACSTPEEAREALPMAEILLVARMPAELYPLLRRCRWIQALWAGVEDMMTAPIPPGMITTRVVGILGGYIAEYILGYTLAHTLRMRQVAAQQADKTWQHFYVGRLEGKTMGLAGLGSIGSEVARRAGALGLKLKGLSRTGAPVEGVTEVYTPAQLTEFCRGLDFLAITLPFTPETDGLFGAEAFQALNPGAVVINCGRGRVIRDEALLDALRSGRVGGAVLDVFAVEPLPKEHPYWTEPGVTVTPHVSGPTVPEDVVRYFLANYERYVKGEPLTGLIDFSRGY